MVRCGNIGDQICHQDNHGSFLPPFSSLGGYWEPCMNSPKMNDPKRLKTIPAYWGRWPRGKEQALCSRESNAAPSLELCEKGRSAKGLSHSRRGSVPHVLALTYTRYTPARSESTARPAAAARGRLERPSPPAVRAPWSQGLTSWICVPSEPK